MNRQERLDMIAELQAKKDASIVEMAERRARLGDAAFETDFVMPRPTVTKSSDDYFDQEASIADQEFQLRHRSARRPQHSDEGNDLVTKRALEQVLDIIADETFSLLAGDFKKVRAEIATLRETVSKLESELALTKALAKGEITLIGKHDAKAS